MRGPPGSLGAAGPIRSSAAWTSREVRHQGPGIEGRLLRMAIPARRAAGIVRRALRWMPGAGASVALAAASILLAACAVPAGTGAPGGAAGPLPPPGYGTLRQEAVSITLRSGDLQLMVTPLAESVTLVTAPDTYRRLSGLARTYGGPTGGDGLFLVSFYAEELEVAFVPEEVQLVSSGIRARPSEILPITPGWGERRVGQRRTESAVYRFDRRIDLESDVVLAYGLERTTEWDTVLPRIRAERARARARAGEHHHDADGG